VVLNRGAVESIGAAESSRAAAKLLKTTEECRQSKKVEKHWDDLHLQEWKELKSFYAWREVEIIINVDWTNAN